MSTKTETPFVKAAFDAVSSAHNAAALAYSCFNDLGTLFQAIADASGEHSQAAKLAKIGAYLADDWANLHDSERESLEPHVAAFRAALGYPPIKADGGGV